MNSVLDLKNVLESDAPLSNIIEERMAELQIDINEEHSREMLRERYFQHFPKATDYAWNNAVAVYKKSIKYKYDRNIQTVRRGILGKVTRSDLPFKTFVVFAKILEIEINISSNK